MCRNEPSCHDDLYDDGPHWHATIITSKSNETGREGGTFHRESSRGGTKSVPDWASLQPSCGHGSNKNDD